MKHILGVLLFTLTAMGFEPQPVVSISGGCRIVNSGSSMAAGIGPALSGGVKFSKRSQISAEFAALSAVGSLIGGGIAYRFDHTFGNVWGAGFGTGFDCFKTDLVTLADTADIRDLRIRQPQLCIYLSASPANFTFDSFSIRLCELRIGADAVNRGRFRYGSVSLLTLERRF